MAAGKQYKRFAGHSVNNAGYHNDNWDKFFDGNELRDVGFDSLAEAITYIGTASKTLIITTKHKISSKTIAPTNISIVALNGGGFTSANSSDLVINGPFSAHKSQVFFGNLVVKFGRSAGLVYTQWWGAIADAVTNCATAFQAANDCLAASTPAGGVVCLPRGRYYKPSVTNVSRDVNWRGEGREQITDVFGDGTSIGFQLNHSTEHQDVVFDGFSINTYDVPVDWAPGSGANNSSSYCTFRNMIIGPWVTAGVRIDGGNVSGDGSGIHNVFDDVQFFGTTTGSGATTAGLGDAISAQGIITTLTFRDCLFAAGARHFYCKGGTIDTIHFFNCSFDKATKEFILLDNSSGFGYAASSLLYRTLLVEHSRFEGGCTEGGGYNGANVSVVNGAVVDIRNNDFQTSVGAANRGTIEIDSFDCRVTDNMIWNNMTYGNACYGVWLKSNSRRCVVEGNQSPRGNPAPFTAIQDDGVDNRISSPIRAYPAATGTEGAVVGDLEIFNNSNILTDKVGLKVAAVGGTQGTLAVTGNFVNGRDYIDTVSSLTGLTKGQRVTAAGVGDYRITYIGDAPDFVPNRVYITPVYAGATANGVAVAWVAPDLREVTTQITRGGIKVLFVGNTNVIGFSSAVPSSGTWTKGDIVFTTVPTIAPTTTTLYGYWECVTTGTPGTWEAKGYGQAFPRSISLHGADAESKAVVAYVAANPAWEFILGSSDAISGGGAGRGGATLTIRSFDNSGANAVDHLVLTRAAGERMAPHLTASATWDPGNLAADGDATSTTITVTGAAVGDQASASLTTIGANNVLISAHVQAADTVRVTLMNKTGGALDIASGTLAVKVWK